MNQKMNRGLWIAIGIAVLIMLLTGASISGLLIALIVIGGYLLIQRRKDKGDNNQKNNNSRTAPGTGTGAGTYTAGSANRAAGPAPRSASATETEDGRLLLRGGIVWHDSEEACMRKLRNDGLNPEHSPSLAVGPDITDQRIIDTTWSFIVPQGAGFRGSEEENTFFYGCGTDKTGLYVVEYEIVPYDKETAYSRAWEILTELESRYGEFRVVEDEWERRDEKENLAVLLEAGAIYGSEKTIIGLTLRKDDTAPNQVYDWPIGYRINVVFKSRETDGIEESLRNGSYFNS